MVRQQRGLTLAECATRAGINAEEWERLELGLDPLPEIDLGLIAEILGKPTCDLCSEK